MQSEAKQGCEQRNNARPQQGQRDTWQPRESFLPRHFLQKKQNQTKSLGSEMHGLIFSLIRSCPYIKIHKHCQLGRNKVFLRILFCSLFGSLLKGCLRKFFCFNTDLFIFFLPGEMLKLKQVYKDRSWEENGAGWKREKWIGGNTANKSSIFLALLCQQQ